MNPETPPFHDNSLSAGRLVHSGDFHIFLRQHVETRRWSPRSYRLYSSSTPVPNALNVSKQKIEIEFDEIIQVDKPSEKVIVSPKKICPKFVLRDVK